MLALWLSDTGLGFDVAVTVLPAMRLVAELEAASGGDGKKPAAPRSNSDARSPAEQYAEKKSA